jgi:pSer/pThr/pTyr-binding forkhead associated (FHA) protein
MWLTVVENGQPKQTVEITGGHFTIGRVGDCDLVLDDPKVSRHHAAISPGMGPTRLLHDLGSANGTLVNGSPVKPTVGFTAAGERIAEINGGEVLQFGDSIVLATLADPRHGPVVPPGPTPGGTQQG